MHGNMQDAAQDADLGGRGTRPPQQDTARLESPHVTLVTFKSPPGHLRCISKSPLRARAEAGVGTQLKAFVVRQEEVLAAAGSSRELQGSENRSRPFFFARSRSWQQQEAPGSSTRSDCPCMIGLAKIVLIALIVRTIGAPCLLRVIRLQLSFPALPTSAS